jgi:hypothetical protein
VATPGERFKMPDGSVYIVRRPAAEADGESVEMEFVLPSGCIPPPPRSGRRGNSRPDDMATMGLQRGRCAIRTRVELEP